MSDVCASSVARAGPVGVDENAGERLTALLALELRVALVDFDVETDAVPVFVTVISVVDVERPTVTVED